MTTKKPHTTNTGSVELAEQELQDTDLQQVRGGHMQYKMSDVTISNALVKGSKEPSAGLMNDPADFPVWE